MPGVSVPAYGASTGASTATRTNSATMTAPAMAAGLRRSRWNAAPHTEVPRASAAASVVSWVAPASTGASAWSTACSAGPPPGLGGRFTLMRHAPSGR